MEPKLSQIDFLHPMMTRQVLVFGFVHELAVVLLPSVQTLTRSTKLLIAATLLTQLSLSESEY